MLDYCCYDLGVRSLQEGLSCMALWPSRQQLWTGRIENPTIEGLKEEIK